MPMLISKQLSREGDLPAGDDGMELVKRALELLIARQTILHEIIEGQSIALGSIKQVVEKVLVNIDGCVYVPECSICMDERPVVFYTIVFCEVM